MNYTTRPGDDYFKGDETNTFYKMSDSPNPHKAKYLLLYDELINTHKVARSKIAELLGIKSNTLSNRIRRDNYYPSLYDVMLLERITELYRRVNTEVEAIDRQVKSFLENLPTSD